MSPMTAEPMTKKAVPWKAVRILKTKKDARLGARAVPILNPVNNVALMTETCVTSLVPILSNTRCLQ
jgi:hypothetical protein